MGEIDCEHVIEVVRTIFRATRTLPPDSFQDWALEEVKKLIPFDFCKWGSGVILNDVVTVHNVHLHNLPPENMDDYLRYQHEDTLLDKMVETRDRVETYDQYEVTPRQQLSEMSIYKNYSLKYGLEHVISTMVPEPVINLYSVVAISRKNLDHPFSEREKRIKKIITPVLTEARSQNIFINMLQNPRDFCMSAAISDAQGVLREAEPPFAELMQEEWPNWKGPKLNFAPDMILNGKRSAHFEGKSICIHLSTFHDLVLLEARHKSALDHLTQAEKNVSALLLQGLANKEIARRLDISPKTVSHHLQSIYKKTGVANRKQAIARLSQGVPSK